MICEWFSVIGFSYATLRLDEKARNDFPLLEMLRRESEWMNRVGVLESLAVFRVVNKPFTPPRTARAPYNPSSLPSEQGKFPHRKGLQRLLKVDGL